MCEYWDRQEPTPEILAQAQPGEILPKYLWLANHLELISEESLAWARYMLEGKSGGVH